MVIKIPQSLFDVIASQVPLSVRIDTTRLEMLGPYGRYFVESVPDEAYTKQVQKLVLEYCDAPDAG